MVPQISLTIRWPREFSNLFLPDEFNCYLSDKDNFQVNHLEELCLIGSVLPQPIYLAADIWVAL